MKPIVLGFRNADTFALQEEVARWVCSAARVCPSIGSRNPTRQLAWR